MVRSKLKPAATALVLAAIALGACTGAEKIAPPAEEPASLYQARPIPESIPSRSSSFSKVVDESIRRKRLLEELRLIFRESNP